MALKNVGPSLRGIAGTLEELQDAREYLLKNSREIIILCSRAIISSHKKDTDAASQSLIRVRQMIEGLKKTVRGDLARYIITPEQEYVEATALIAIIKHDEIPSADALGVMPESYVLGLLDCVGELKRVVYDRIREGDTGEAVRVFGIMEDLYLDLYTFSMYDKVVKEARRKVDVGRIMVEDVRAAVTEEQRRSELIRAMRS